MDVIFDKLGLFDFFGIMGPGIMTTSYYAVCYSIVTGNYHYFIKSTSVFKVLIFLIISYLCGIILHEIGKLIFDNLKTFDAEKKKEEISNKTINQVSNNIEKEYINIIKKIKNFVCNNDFNYILGKLKYTAKSTRKIEAYHSIYGQARGMLVSFFINISFVVFLLVLNNDSMSYRNKLYVACIIVFDCIMIKIFYLRTYRYFLVWIRNVYYQAYFEFEHDS